MPPAAAARGSRPSLLTRALLILPRVAQVAAARLELDGVEPLERGGLPPSSTAALPRCGAVCSVCSGGSGGT
jgi:hypothetical protein